MLTLFTTAVAAEEIVMKCDEYTYKYTQDPAGDKVFWKHKKWTKNKYEEWCIEFPAGAISSEGWVRIIKDNKATCLFKKMTFSNPTEVVTNSVSVTDFVNFTRHIEMYAASRGSKKDVYDFTCKKLLN